MKSLDALPVGGSGHVAQVTGDDDLALRLMEMGIIPGTPIKIVGLAPWGDPLELEVRGYRLSLRRTEARRVLLEDAGSTSSAP